MGAGGTIAAVSILSPLVEFFLPQDCFLCGLRASGAVLCAPCIESLPRLRGPGCPVCARPTPGGAHCGRCLKTPPHFDACFAAFEYRPPFEQLITSLKYAARLQLADFLAEALVKHVPRIEADCLIAMPLHRQRLAERGFNQSMEIVRRVGTHWGLPVKSACVRDVHTAPQATLNFKDRARNVRGAFRCLEPLRGQHVVVVDDVITSGSSLHELARVIKAQGAARVSALVLARTLPRPGGEHV
jgi:ComF family protein